MTVGEGVVVDVKGLQMRYGSVDVLRSVDFQVRRGEVVVLLGPNGAGKTTTIEILEGFRTRSGGQARVLGVDPAEGDEAWRARVGVVLQSWRDHSRWRVRELLTHLRSFYLPYADRLPGGLWEVDELLAVVGLTDHAEARISTLSGGERRRMDVAIGVVGGPEVLFLDEPTAALDPEARREFHDLVHRLADERDTTILLTTHDLDEADKLADRLLILAGGRIIADGTSDELARRISGEAEIRWTHDGSRFVHTTSESTKFVHELFQQYGTEIDELEVRRASLEDSYTALVRRCESGASDAGIPALEEMTR